MKKIQFLFTLTILLFAFGCSNQNSNSTDRIIIGINEDVDSFNPLYALKENEGIITELLNLSLVKHEWDDKNSSLVSKPMLAKSWIWAKDSLSLIVDLRENIYWSDSTEITTEDIVFSFATYSHSDVNSKFYGTFDNFYTDENNQIELKKSFEILSPSKIKISFKPGSMPSMFDIDYPLIPKHAFKDIEKKNFSTSDFNFSPITSGPYSLIRWDKNQSVTR